MQQGCRRSLKYCNASLRYRKVRSRPRRDLPSNLCSVTTRTTSLVSVPHQTFGLRFSDIHDIEKAVHEDEEQRAGRTMDWIGSRISERCQSWVDMLGAGRTGEDESQQTDIWRDRTPWWEEVKRCVQGDHVPSSVEGWNHPVSRTCHCHILDGLLKD